MTSKELIEIGFIEDIDIVDKEKFSSFSFGKDLAIEITGLKLVELKISKVTYVEITECKTINDVKEIIRIFNIKN